MATYEGMRVCVEMYLSYISSLVRSMDDIETQIARCTSQMELLGVDYSRRSIASSSAPQHGDDAIVDGLMRLHDARAELLQEIERSQQAIGQAHIACHPGWTDVSGTDEERKRIISGCGAMWLRAVQGMPWSHVAKAIGYSTSWVKHTGRELGVAAIYARMPEHWRSDAIPDALPE